MEVAAGGRLGPYPLMQEVAEGGFGEVYRTRLADGRPAAIKILHAELARDPILVERFAREARLVALVRHAAVVAVLDAGVADGRPYLVMEWLDGLDLRAHLRTHGRLAPAAARDVIVEVAGALDAAHAVGVVHRDVKASNVFLVGGRPAPGARVVLVDFGVAKLLDDTRPALTSSRHVVGTPPCMSPEQVLGERIDARSDVYALGVLAYHALTGRVPFDHERAAMVMEMHVSAAPPRVSARAPVAPAVDEVVARAMAKKPAERWPSAGAFARALDAALAGRAATLPPGMADAATPPMTARRAVDVEIALAPALDPDDETALAALVDADGRLRAAAAAVGLEVTQVAGNVLRLSGDERALADADTVIAEVAGDSRVTVRGRPAS